MTGCIDLKKVSIVNIGECHIDFAQKRITKVQQEFFFQRLEDGDDKKKTLQE